MADMNVQGGEKMGQGDTLRPPLDHIHEAMIMTLCYRWRQLAASLHTTSQ